MFGHTFCFIFFKSESTYSNFYTQYNEILKSLNVLNNVFIWNIFIENVFLISILEKIIHQFFLIKIIGDFLILKNYFVIVLLVIYYIKIIIKLKIIGNQVIIHKSKSF